MERLRCRLPLLSLLLALLTLQCQSPKARRIEASRLDSLRRDSARAAATPHTPQQEQGLYDRERENLGNLDSLVTIAQPSVHP